MRAGRRRWWTRLITAAAVLLVLAASVSVAFRLLVEAVPRYRRAVADYASQVLGRPVTVGSIALVWSHFRPELDLHDLAVPGVALAATRVRLGFHYSRLLRGDRKPSSIDIHGLALEASLDANGRWSLRGFDADHVTFSLPMLLAFDRFSVADARLTVHLWTGPTVQAGIRRAGLRHDGDQVRLEADLAPPPEWARQALVQGVLATAPGHADRVSGIVHLHIEPLQALPGWATLLRDPARPQLQRALFDADAALVDSRLDRLDAWFRADRIALRDDPQSALADVRLALHLRRQDAGWIAELAPLRFDDADGAQTVRGLQLAFDTGGVRVRIDELPLGAVMPWVAALRAVPAGALTGWRLDGALRDVRFRRDFAGPDPSAAAPRFALHATFADLAVADGAQRRIEGLQGRLAADNGGGQLQIDDAPLRLRAPAWFEAPLAIDHLSAALQWTPVDGGGWQFRLQPLTIATLGGQAQGEGEARLDAGGRLQTPRLDLQLQADDAAAFKAWIPRVWSLGSRDWLKAAVRHARIQNGALHLEMAKAGTGPAGAPAALAWTLALDARDGELAFSPDWPKATRLSAHLAFKNDGLDVEVDGGRLGTVPLRTAHARIPDLRGSTLTLDGELAGDAAPFYAALRASPLRTRLQDLLTRTTATGAVDLHLHLGIPLDQEPLQIAATGQIDLDQVRLQVHGLDVPLTGLSGQIRFDDQGLHADALDAHLLDTELNAQIAPEAGASDGVLTGRFALAPGPVDGLAAHFLPAWLAGALEGVATVSLRLPLSGADAGVLSLSSDLQGLTSTLPPPLAKSAETQMPVSLRVDDADGETLRVLAQVPPRLSAMLRFGRAAGGSPSLAAVALHLGEGEPPVTDADGLVIDGHPAQLAPWPWLAVLGGGDGTADRPGLPFVRADLTADRLALRRATLGPVEIHVVPTGGGLHLTLTGAAQGEADWHRGPGGAVAARFMAVRLDALPEAAEAPVVPPAAIPDQRPPFAPAQAPTLDLDIAALTVGAVRLGHLQLITQRIADGQSLAVCRLDGGALSLTAEGRWQRGGEQSTADLRFQAATGAMADLLRAFGEAPAVRAAQTHLDGDLHWLPATGGLSLAQAAGPVSLTMKRGALQAVKPGAARVLGLFNLYALPRRLLFDFRDVVAKGLAFDKLGGHFALGDGNAVTQDLDIVGPSSKIEVRGRVGLAARDYDQRVTVIPDLSTGVTLGATLLGGPIGGGVALVAQQLFGKPFNQLGKFSYRVVGSWDNPDVIKGSSEARPAEAPPPPAALPMREPNGGTHHG